MEAADNAGVVSDFFIKTCTTSGRNILSTYIAILSRFGDPSLDKGFQCSLTGSAAELYITPAISCLGDLDVMIPNKLVFAAGSVGDDEDFAFKNPKQLGLVKIMQPDEQNRPGYAILHPQQLEGDEDIDVFKTWFDLHQSAGDDIVDGGGGANKRHGPAERMSLAGDCRSVARMFPEWDFVPCIFCPVWPDAARNWTRRTRPSGWPSESVVETIVENGCNFVPMAHRDDRSNAVQWRFSFSRAEVVLLNTWTPIQQIVYHMLRFIVKAELITDDACSGRRARPAFAVDPTSVNVNADDEILSGYHLKTVVLWMCEEKSPEYWTGRNVVDLCADALSILAQKLDGKNCPHYFIPECNLFARQLDADRLRWTLDRLKEFSDAAVVADWFVHNYILKVNARRSETLSERSKAETVDSTSVNLRELLNKTINDYYILQSDIKFEYQQSMHKHLVAMCDSSVHELYESCFRTRTDPGKDPPSRFTAKWYVDAMNAMSTVDQTYFDLLVAATVLQMAVEVKYCNMSGVNFGHFASSARAMFTKRQLLATDAKILIELSKECLHEKLRRRNANSESNYCETNVYLALLYYQTGCLQMSIDHCRRVTCRPDHSQCAGYPTHDAFPNTTGFVEEVGLFYLYAYLAYSLQHRKRSRKPKCRLFPWQCTALMFASFFENRVISGLSATTAAPDESGRISAITETRSHQETAASVQKCNDILVDLLILSACEHLQLFKGLATSEYISAGQFVIDPLVVYLFQIRGNYRRVYVDCAQYYRSRTLKKPLNSKDDDSLRLNVNTSIMMLIDEQILNLIALVRLTHHRRPSVNKLQFTLSQNTVRICILRQCCWKLGQSDLETILRNYKYKEYHSAQFDQLVNLFTNVSILKRLRVPPQRPERIKEMTNHPEDDQN